MEEFYIDADGIRLHAKLERPENSTHSSLMILLHGLTGHMEERHIVAVKDAVLSVGCAVLRVELYGHGMSDGTFARHTLYKWIDNVLSVIDYAKTLDWVQDLYLCGHSQGGYATMLVAGLRPKAFRAIVPLSPAIVIEYGSREGSMLGGSFDPNHIPETVYLGDPALVEHDAEARMRRTLNADYFAIAQTLHVNEAIDRFGGPVLIVHGDDDTAVPISYSVEAAGRYKNCRLVCVEGDTHTYAHHLDEVTDAVARFMTEQLA